MKRENLTRFAWLSIFAAVVTIGLKTAAYLLTGSVGLLSDALESLINLAAAVIALWMLKIAAIPPDDEHAYGHDKAEFFASAIEGTLILIAAAGIAWAAVERLLAPRPLEQIGIGIAVTTLAAGINLAVGLILIRAGKRHESIALEADGEHLLTDVWTSAGVVAAVVAVSLTGWLVLDSIVALVVAANITWTGIRLLSRSAHGLLDAAIAPEKQNLVVEILDRYARKEKIEYHALRTRQAGVRAFISVHIVVPGEWTVTRGHQLCEEIEAEMRREVKNAIVFTHLESLDDPASWQDIELDRL